MKTAVVPALGKHSQVRTPQGVTHTQQGSPDGREEPLTVTPTAYLSRMRSPTAAACQEAPPPLPLLISRQPLIDFWTDQ